MPRKILKYFILSFCLLYTLDGLISVLHILSAFLDFSFKDIMMSVRLKLAYFTLFLSLPLLFFFSLSKLTKKSVLFLLPLSYLFICVFVYFSMVIEAKYLSVEQLFINKSFNESIQHFDFFFIQVISCLFQLILGTFALLWVKNDMNYFLENHSLNLFKRLSLSIITPTLVVSSYIFVSIAGSMKALEMSSQSYIKIESQGIVLTEKIFSKGKTKVRLIPMIHLGSKSFYQELSKDYELVTTLYLLEGVKDKENLLANFNFRSLASSTGQSLQSENFEPRQEEEEYQTNMIRAISADIDVSEMGEETVDFLKQVNNLYRFDGIQSIISLLSILENEDLSQVYYDIIEKRNNNLIALLKDNESKYKTVIIPWGALHCPDIQKQLIEMGYKETEDSKSRVAVNFLKD